MVSVASAVRKPATISSQTQSISVTVNGGTPQNFNTSSCSGTPNITCVLSVGVNYGLDSFLILTYSGPNATGTPLNAAAVTLNVTAAGPNTASATAGNILTVNTNADGSGGSNSCAAGSTTCTLREAVAEASTTAGIVTAIMFSGVTSITVGSPLTITNQNVIVLGPGASAANTAGVGAPTASSNLTISGGNSTGIFIVDSGSLLVDGLTLANGYNASADEAGAAIENYANLAIVNMIFSGNNAGTGGSGGAVYDEGPGGTNDTVLASTFTNNTAEEGGAYYDEDGTSFSRCLFTNNVAFDNSDYGEGGAIYADANISVDTSTFTSNIAGNMAIAAEGYGGAISIEDESVGASITNSTFGGSTAASGNFAGGPGGEYDSYGGAIYEDAGYPTTLSGNTFANNKVEGYYVEGGAAALSYGANATGDSYSNNVADASAGDDEALGGALYTDDVTTLTNETFTSNSALSGYDEYAYGGAVYVDDTLTASNLTFTGNSAVGTGGAYVYGGAAWVDDLIGTNLTFTNNSATSSANIEGEAYGGGLYVSDDLTLTTATFSNNSASAEYAYGGGAYTDGVLGLSNASFTSNTATGGNASAYGEAYAGGFYQDPPTLGTAQAARLMVKRGPHSQLIARLTARDARHAAHQSRHAAQLAAHPLTTTHKTIEPKSKMVAIRNVHHVKAVRTKIAQTPVQGQRRTTQSITWSSLTVTSNVASGGLGGYAYGGGMYFDDDATVTGTFSQNHAIAGTGGSTFGGAIYCDDELTFTGSVTNNVSTTEGGGLYSDDVLLVEASTITGNSVSSAQNSYDGGGGIYSDSTIVLDMSTVNGNTVSGSVAGSGGGGIFNDSDLTITNSTIFGNTSAINGGGIENQSSATVINATVFGNTATTAGGSLDNSSSTFIQNSIFAGGTATGGAELNNTSSLTSNDYNLIQGTITGSFTPGSHDKLGVSPLISTSSR